MPDLSVHLLNAEQRLVPVGVAGEIYVGGSGLSRGYLNRPELTRDRFVEIGGRRLYRSGDLGRWRPDGTLEYAGRIDHQVKIRGYRIEPGEIEAVLTQHPNVREAVVVTTGSPPHHALAAYAAPSAPVSDIELRQWLAAHLPDYMVPTHIVCVPLLPLNHNGKIDTKALPDPVQHAESTSMQAPPRDDLERQIAAIWVRALGRDDFGIETSLFAVGGHSLTLMQIVSRIYQTFRVQVPLADFYQEPTISALARLVRQTEQTSYQRIPLAPTQPDYPLSHEQLQIWLDHQLSPSAAYNMPDAVEFPERLDPVALQQALDQLADRHEVLRTAFIRIDGEPRQVIRPEMKLVLKEIDLLQGDDSEAQLRSILESEASEAFDLEHPPLVRATLIHRPGNRSVISLVMHHIVGDGWTRNLLYQELSVLYDSARRQVPHGLNPLAIQYKDFATWQKGLTFEAERRYWGDQLEGAPRRLKLPVDIYGSSLEEGGHRGWRCTAVLDPNVSGALRVLAQSCNTTLSNVTLALFDLLLFEITGQEDFCVGMAVASRHAPELEPLAGLFVNVLPIRARLNDETELEDLLVQLRDTVTKALEYQKYPFNLLVRDVARTGFADQRPFLDAVYVFQSASDVRLEIPGSNGSGSSAARRKEVPFRFARFDLCLSVMDRAQDGVELTLECNARRFADETIAEYVGSMEATARKIADWVHAGRPE